MNVTALIDRLDDWINPIVVKELRQAVKSRVVIVLMLVFLALQLFIVGMALLFRQAQSLDGEADWNAGRDVFVWIQGVLAFTLILLVPAYACVRLAAERSDQNVDLLFISTLKPSSIVAGKFFAAFVLGVLIFSCCAPFMTFMYLMRGLDIPTILFILGIDLLALLYSTMVGMLLASIPGGTIVKVIAIFLGYFFHLFWVAYTVIGLTTVLVTFEPPSWDSPKFWAIVAACSGATVAAIGLMFTYCTAMISPASSNRVLLIRVYVLAIWTSSLGALFLLGRYLGDPMAWMAVLICWTIVMAIILGMQFVISISERDQYGPRLQRQIPRNLLLRIPAFFLYTGAANGILFTTALSLATMVIGAIALDRANAAVHGAFGGPGGPVHHSGDSSVTFQIALVQLLYLFNYGLTAVLLRVYLLGGQIRPGYTWLVQMLLIGLGSAIPPLIAFALFEDHMGANNDTIWWKLPSPFLAAFNVANDFPQGTINQDYLTVTLWFLGIWCVLVSLLSLPWLVRQIVSFQPRGRSRSAETETVPTAELAEPKPLPMEAVKGPESAPAPTAPPVDGMVSELPPATSVQTG